MFYTANYQEPGQSAYPIEDWDLLSSHPSYTETTGLLASSGRNATTGNASDAVVAARTPSGPTGPRTVNGCLDAPNVFMQMQYLFESDTFNLQRLKRRKIKVVFLLRDPTDWLWSAWNFWTNKKGPEDNFHPAVNDWASAPLQFRSPELFYEYMLAGT